MKGSFDTEKVFTAPSATQAGQCQKVNVKSPRREGWKGGHVLEWDPGRTDTKGSGMVTAKTPERKKILQRDLSHVPWKRQTVLLVGTPAG